MTKPAQTRAFVIGHPIAHSRSPLMHGHWLKELGLPGSYERIDVAPTDLGAFIKGLKSQGFVGGNVTVPHKQHVMAMADRLDQAATDIGAVNTLWFEGETLVGGNTDALGFLGNLDDKAPGWHQRKRAVVMGAGGAARAAVFALRSRGCDIQIFNRTFEHATTLATAFGSHVSARPWNELGTALPSADLLVNTTSLGMLGKAPLEIDLGTLRVETIVYDIVYVPLETDLVRHARARGLKAVDGLGMLLHQAPPGFECWFGVRPIVTPKLRALMEADIRSSTPGA